uniref:Uncharacterized protein n=1 Tax=Rhizophora mucronata TaxID=61149 RepID=A0A2P2QK99_RHIMU
MAFPRIICLLFQSFCMFLFCFFPEFYILIVASACRMYASLFCLLPFYFFIFFGLEMQFLLLLKVK